ncbi:MAG: hypothetical protein VYA67_22035 [Actinomycetota bacterium]|nr:hypothetical protein [Actinomycetota bacterium]
MTITVDGDTLMDADTGQWTTKPPELEQLNLRGGGNNPQPWLQTIMFILAKAGITALSGQTTTEPDNRWTMTVETTNGHTNITVTTK